MAMTVSSELAKEFHLYKFGPVYVGKGLSGNLLKARYGPHVHQIVIGDLVRNRMATDLAFQHEFAEMLSKRDLLSDPVVLPMAKACYEAGKLAGNNFFEWDGIGRTGMQIEILAKWELLEAGSTECLFLEASDETCWQRYLHSLENQTRKHRNDNTDKNFWKAMRIYKQHRPFVFEALHAAGIEPVIIDANKPLREVAEEVIKHALKLHYPIGWPESEPRQKTTDLVTSETVGHWSNIKGLSATVF